MRYKSATELKVLGAKNPKKVPYSEYGHFILVYKTVTTLVHTMKLPYLQHHGTLCLIG